jgi:chromosome segregation ATPase
MERSRRSRSLNDVPRTRRSSAHQPAQPETAALGAGTGTAPNQPKRSPTNYGQHVAELEKELTDLRAAVAAQKREFEENSANFAQALNRISHNERTLSLTKTKLLAAEEAALQAGEQTKALRVRVQELEAELAQRLEQERGAQVERDRTVAEIRERAAAELEGYSSEAARLREALAAALEREPTFRQAEAELRSQLEASAQRAAQSAAQHQELRALAESLSRDSAAGADECARLAESLRLAEERKAGALAEAESLGDELAAALTQLAETRSKLAELEMERATLGEKVEQERVELEVAKRAANSANEDRRQLIQLLGVVETMAHRIARTTLQARAARADDSDQQATSETEEDRATLRPAAAPPSDALRGSRRSSAPEISIDGVLLTP